MNNTQDKVLRYKAAIQRLKEAAYYWLGTNSQVGMQRAGTIWVTIWYVTSLIDDLEGK